MSDNVRYFYTKDSPHEWSSGPQMLYGDPENEYKWIESLDRARELALAARRGKPGYKGYVITTYGASYPVPDLDVSDEPDDWACQQTGHHLKSNRHTPDECRAEV